MKPTKKPKASTRKPPAKDSPKTAPDMDEVDREIESFDTLLAGIVGALLQEDQDPARRLKLVPELNKVMERKHRRSMEQKRLQLERERFEHQREVKRQELEMKQQALEIRRQELEIKRLNLEMKRQGMEAKRERAKGKAGFEAPAPAPVQGPVNAVKKAQARKVSSETSTKGREISVRGFQGGFEEGRSGEVGIIGTNAESVVETTIEKRDAAGILRMNVPTPAPQRNALPSAPSRPQWSEIGPYTGGVGGLGDGRAGAITGKIPQQDRRLDFHGTVTPGSKAPEV